MFKIVQRQSSIIIFSIFFLISALEHEKWFAIILDSNFHGKGFGTKLLSLGKEKESELNGWVIDKQDDKRKNGELYKSPLNFYLKNGFEKFDNERLELEKISAVKIKWKK